MPKKTTPDMLKPGVKNILEIPIASDDQMTTSPDRTDTNIRRRYIPRYQ